MTAKIISDSGANVLELDSVSFSNVPLTIHAGGKDFKDDEQLDVDGLVRTLHETEGRTSTACPGISQWHESFEGADEIYVITITSILSGSYSSAARAADLYLEEHPDTKIHVFDSLSAGPEMELVINKLSELIKAGNDFATVCRKTENYMKTTHMTFSLESLENLAKNGRVSPAVAKIAGMLNIRVIGRPDDGKLTPIAKARGARKTIKAIIRDMDEHGFNSGHAVIVHIMNEDGAESLKQAILEAHPRASVSIRSARGLCTYYAQKGGLMVGYEGAE